MDYINEMIETKHAALEPMGLMIELIFKGSDTALFLSLN